MTKYELSIMRDYVPGWGVVDAVRELFQNALDQEIVNPDNAMFFEYDSATETLRIGNKTSVLLSRSLLLGATTKANDSNTIGQFGEGYKVATLVLCRLGFDVVFYNYGCREVWTPRLVRSRKYQAEVLTFFVDKKYPWEKVPDNDLVIEVKGIDVEQYKDIVRSNLHLDHSQQVLETPKGNILLDERFAGRIFVNGLWVCDHKDYKYGYDFKPQYLKLDRDRKLVSDFDLKWLASSLWVYADDSRAAELIKEGAADVAYVTSHIKWEQPKKIVQEAITSFKAQYGDNAVPVVTQSEMESVKEGYKPVIVSESYRDVLTSDKSLIVPVKQRETPRQKLKKWLELHEQSLSKKAISQLRDIIEEL